MLDAREQAPRRRQEKEQAPLRAPSDQVQQAAQRSPLPLREIPRPHGACRRSQTTIETTNATSSEGAAFWRYIGVAPLDELLGATEHSQ